MCALCRIFEGVCDVPGAAHSWTDDKATPIQTASFSFFCPKGQKKKRKKEDSFDFWENLGWSDRAASMHLEQKQFLTMFMTFYTIFFLLATVRST